MLARELLDGVAGVCQHRLMNAKQLLAEALRLTSQERAALASELIESLDEPIDNDAEAACRSRFAVGSSGWMLVSRRPCRGPRPVVGSSLPPGSILTLEYLDEALTEAEEAARWYAARSVQTAAAFARELDVAASAIERAPSTWPTYDHGTRRFLLRRFPYGVVYRIEPSRIVVVAVAHGRVGLVTGRTDSRRHRPGNAPVGVTNSVPSG